jgi:hypothetical protein
MKITFYVTMKICPAKLPFFVFEGPPNLFANHAHMQKKTSKHFWKQVSIMYARKMD